MVLYILAWQELFDKYLSSWSNSLIDLRRRLWYQMHDPFLRVMVKI